MNSGWVRELAYEEFPEVFPESSSRAGSVSKVRVGCGKDEGPVQADQINSEASYRSDTTANPGMGPRSYAHHESDARKAGSWVEKRVLPGP